MSEATTVKYYVTTYALTKGILEILPGAAHFSQFPGTPKYLYVGDPGMSPTQVLPIDYHLTVADAQKRAGQMKEARLRSLEKSIAKIKNYTPRVRVWEQP